MSYGLVICSACKREVHQDGENQTWRHCEDKTPRCEGAVSSYPTEKSEIIGDFCGKDDMEIGVTATDILKKLK